MRSESFLSVRFYLLIIIVESFLSLRIYEKSVRAFESPIISLLREKSSHRLFGKIEVRRFVSDLIPMGTTNEPRL